MSSKMTLRAIAIAVFAGFAQDALAPGSARQGQAMVGGTGSAQDHCVTGMTGAPTRFHKVKA
jgi:hypothetical protein